VDQLTLLRRELTYELGVIDYCHDRLTQCWAVDGSEQSKFELGQSTAMLESFLIHARAVDEFLGGRGRAREDDLSATAFAPEWSRRGCLSDNHRTQMDKQLAHLTTHRIERGQWEIHGLARDIASTFLDWVSLLDPDRRADVEAPTEHAQRLTARAADAWPPRLNLGFRWADPQAPTT
jgi:hypothetical protein